MRGTPHPVRLVSGSVRYLAASLCTLMMAQVSLAQSLPATVPQPRTDANSARAHEDLLTKRGKGRIDVYFIGDSITRRWGAAERKYQPLLAHWQQSFHGWHAANFGWGADRIQNMLWRLDNGELDGVNPKVIVVMAGTNNLQPVAVQPREAQVADVVAGIGALLERCRRMAPGARIVLMGITPRNDDRGHIETIRAINARLAGMADGSRVRFLDLAPRLADADGNLLPGMTDADRLHLALPGYEQWAAALRPVLRDWLGPPDARDLAPPATGDPSAMTPR